MSVIDLETTSTTGRDMSQYDGYYCISTMPITCSCGYVMKFVEVDTRHIIVVWEEMDDDNLLENAKELKKFDMDPRVVEYEVGYGPAIDFYKALEKGLIMQEGVERE